MNIPPLSSASSSNLHLAQSGVKVLAGELPSLNLNQVQPAVVLANHPQSSTVKVQGQTITLNQPLPFPPGTEVGLQVLQLVPQPIFKVIPPEASPVEGKRPLVSESLQLGQEIIAKVAEVPGKNQLVLEWEGQTFSAQLPSDSKTSLASFPAGTQLTLQVAQLQPQVVLQMMNQEIPLPNQALQLFQNQVGVSEPLGKMGSQLPNPLQLQFPSAVPQELAQPLEALFQKLFPQQSPTLENVQTLFENGGLQYESKLAQAILSERNPADLSAFLAQIPKEDAKGLILQILNHLESASSDSPPDNAAAKSGSVQNEGGNPKPPLAGSGTKALQEYLGNLEAQQITNVAARLNDQPFQFQIPFPVENGWATAHLSVDPDFDDPTGKKSGPDRGKPKGHSLLFAMDLEGLGRTRIDAYVTPGFLRAHFFVEPSCFQMVKEELAEFESRLQALGFNEVYLGVRPIAELAPEKKQQVSAMQAGVPRGLHRLDVQA